MNQLQPEGYSNLSNPKTKQAREILLSLLKGQDPLTLETVYSQCDCDYDSIAGALSSMIEKEEILIGRLKTRFGWLIGEKSAPATSGATWYTSRGDMRKTIPKVLTLLKKLDQAKEPVVSSERTAEQLKVVAGLLGDGIPRTREEIIAATGFEYIRLPVWRSFRQLPDGRYTLPDLSLIHI